MMRDNVHPNIAEIVESEESPEMSITMKFCAFGNLRQTTANYPWDRRDTFRQTFIGLSFLHRRKIVHRDLKPENILVKTIMPFRIALADFGFARSFDSRVASTNVGTVGYTAPEIDEGNYYGPPVDIYSTGVIMLDVFSIPWRCRLMEDVAADLDRNYDKMHQLVARMLNEDPKARPTADQCLDHGCKIEIFKKVKTKEGELIIDIEDLTYNSPTQAPQHGKVPQAAKLPNIHPRNSKSPMNPVALATLSKERTVRAAQVSNGRQIGSTGLSNSDDSLRSLFSDRTVRAGQSPQTSAIFAPKQTSQAPSKRIDRSRSLLPVDGHQRTDASRASNTSNSTPRVTRAAAAAAAERASHQPYPMPPVKSSHGPLAPSAKSRDASEKKGSGISRVWGKK
ncbi:kinase-like domain-containing protein [Phyllosticta citrichinensis]|uniref:non-specific serine/threonine protein kinase n=1 Tax=Phyllosticta citrichinensis TaxID=1130410 RepID=A0ABR1Y5F4_9PEZI